MNKIASTPLHILVGVIVILGGILYLFNQNGLGLIITSLALLIEAIINWVGKIEIIIKNVLIGVAVIILNLVPLILKKYKLVPITLILSLIIMLLGIYLN